MAASKDGLLRRFASRNDGLENGIDFAAVHQCDFRDGLTGRTLPPDQDNDRDQALTMIEAIGATTSLRAKRSNPALAARKDGLLRRFASRNDGPENGIR